MKLNSITMYSFFILVDTNDPLNFHIEMTKMNYRLRFSALKSNHIRKYGKSVPVRIHTHSDENISDDDKQNISLPGYHNVLKSNYTFYLLDKRHLTSEQANQHKLNLIEHFKKNVKPASAGRDKFKVSF